MKHSFTGFFMGNDEKYIKRTFQLARMGVGLVNPNPLVGAVIVKDDRVIAEGFHREFGGDHAEIDAIKNTTESVEGSTVYVNLEPCSHHGKTPPCAQRLIDEKVKRVVIAMRDPNPQVSGEGIKMLRNAGIEVTENILKEEALDLNRVFVKYITQGLPYVVMKAAMTLDGKIATRVGDSRWVSGEASRKIVHELRNEYAAIMVGINTVIGDDPELTTRLTGNREGRNPARIIVDSALRIPMDAKVLRHQNEPHTILAHDKQASVEKLKILREGGVKTIQTNSEYGKNVDLSKLMTELGKMSIDGILLEGGGTLNYSALKAGIVDEVFFFVAPKIVGGTHAKTPVEGKGVDVMNNAFKFKEMKTMNVGEDLMIRAKLDK